MRYLATVAYDGTNYVGWQSQTKGQSVQQEIESALSQILNNPTKIYGSGRTDAGVHANGQTFHFDTNKEIKDLFKFAYSLNSIMSGDIYISNIEKVADDFNARYDVKSKKYIYWINTGKYDPFQRGYMYQLLRPLDIERMQEGLKMFIGEHNFMNFTSKEEDQANFVRNIYNAELIIEKDVIGLSFEGNGFMRYMVRMLVGTLIEVGLGKLDVSDIKKIMESKDRKVVSYKAPACGLYLEKVMY